MKKAALVLFPLVAVLLSLLPLRKSRTVEGITVSNTDAVSCLDGDYRAVLVADRGTLQRVVLVKRSDSTNVSVEHQGGGYQITFAADQDGTRRLRQQLLEFQVSAIDANHELKAVFYDGTLDELGKQLQAGEGSALHFRH